MRELITGIPDVDVLLALEPEELGAKLLFLIRPRQEQREEMFTLTGMSSELWAFPPVGPKYPRERQSEILLALREAWAWLEAQGLIIPAEEPNGRNGWRVLSRRARKFENPAEFANYAVARRLPKETLHLRISGPVWMSFMGRVHGPNPGFPEPGGSQRPLRWRERDSNRRSPPWFNVNRGRTGLTKRASSAAGRRRDRCPAPKDPQDLGKYLVRRK
jgi:hypothetical protein